LRAVLDTPSHVPDARAVDQYVEGIKLFCHGLCHGRYRQRVCQVNLHKETFAALSHDSGDLALAAADVSVGNDDQRALGGKSVRGGTPHARSATRDKRSLGRETCESVCLGIHLMSPWWLAGGSDEMTGPSPAALG
jgi:hypothetical protein